VDSRKGVFQQIGRGLRTLTLKEEELTTCRKGPKNWRTLVTTVVNLLIPYKWGMEFIQVSSRSLTTANIQHSLSIRKHGIKIKGKILSVIN